MIPAHLSADYSPRAIDVVTGPSPGMLASARNGRFGFEPEITARPAHFNARIFEVPVSYSGRTYLEGKKITWRDGFAAMLHIVRYNLFP
jgi:hypothetical protein